MRGNSVRVVLSPSVTDAVSRGFTRALQTEEVQNLKKEKMTLPRCISTGLQSEDQEVTTFVDADAGEEYSEQNVDVNRDMYKLDSTLANFLARPVLIHSIAWGESSSIDDAIYPWQLFFSDSVIKNKIQNYNYISCTMKVKALINASPFYYGCAGIFYQPLIDFDPAPIIEVSGYTGSLVPYSQRPHIWLYPAQSQGGTLELPFLNPRQWLDLTNDDEVRDFGRLHIKSLTSLMNANSVSGTGCDIQIYAWIENVKMCGPTITAALQAGDTKVSAKHIEQKYDESPKISSIASSVSRMAAKASALPAPFGTAASAVSLASGAVGKIAGLFGYTNTPVVDDVQGFKNLPFHGLASCEISTPVDRLTLDPKNILAKNPEAIGVERGDEMDIANFCARESYLTQFNWAAADVLDDLLWGTVVMPRMMRRDGSTAYTWQMTPMCIPAYMFENWRGNLVYRFRFICTKYHRGRVRITWDPNTNLTSLPNTKVSNYNRIVDLAEETDISIEIPYLAPTAFCRNGTGYSQYYGTTPPSPNHEYDNGQLTLRVLNQQTSPILSADIVCLVSVYGKDMEFAQPRDVTTKFTAYPLQSTDTYVEGKESEPLFEDTAPPANLNEIYMGEHVSSFDQLIKRSAYHGSVFFPDDDISMLRFNFSTFNRFPRYPGYDPDAEYLGYGQLIPGTAFPYNFVHWTPITWISQCFVCCRGSINWHVNAVAGKQIASLRASRYLSAIANTDLTNSTAISNGATQSELASWCVRRMDAGCAGLTLTNGYTQSALSINAPFYNQNKFRNVSSTHATLGYSGDATNTDNLRVTAVFTPELTMKSGEMHFDNYVSAGPDYNLSFFLNVPSMVELNTVPDGVLP